MEQEEARKLILDALFSKERISDDADKVTKFFDLESTNIFLENEVELSCLNFLLGSIYIDFQNFEKAKSKLSKIKKNEFNLVYYAAQMNLYDLTKDVSYLENIDEDVKELYSQAQYYLGCHERDISKKYIFWKNIKIETELYNEVKYEILIIKKIIELEDGSWAEKLHHLFIKIKEVLESLIVDIKYEKHIAHYTSLSVARTLMKIDQSEGNSFLRLSNVHFMNDPEEGFLLNKLLNSNNKVKTKDVAFLSCFTLHHDSLNQFRLYGKDNHKEATGVSLVISEDFFSRESTIGKIINKIEEEKKQSIGKNTINLQSKLNEGSLSAMPLYRCIYLDPISGLIRVAQREEWSFHREYKKENEESILDSNPEAERYWGEYQNKILKIESTISSNLKGLVEQLQIFNKENISAEVSELIAEILLPLRYLIKHMAFKEEQECRMIYVTQMDNPLIKYDEKINRIYIDYEPSVMEHLEKIYLAPKAKDEKMVFEYLCSRGQEVRKGKPPVKVKISQNPFR
jgi:protein O-GlcNAc transferase